MDIGAVMCAGMRLDIGTCVYAGTYASMCAGMCACTCAGMYACMCAGMCESM